MIIKNIDSHQEADPATRHKEIQNEINKQCGDWPVKRACQKRNFKLIEKCFDGWELRRRPTYQNNIREEMCTWKTFFSLLIRRQQKFVFYFLLALTDTICQDGDQFVGMYGFLQLFSTKFPIHVMRFVSQFSEFWESGGNKCLNEHLMKLTNEISDCLTFTSTMTKDELDKYGNFSTSI